MWEIIAAIVGSAVGGVLTAVFISGQYKAKVDGHEERLDKVEDDVEEVKKDVVEMKMVSVRIDENLKAIKESVGRVERQNIGLMKTISRTRVSKTRR